MDPDWWPEEDDFDWGDDFGTDASGGGSKKSDPMPKVNVDTGASDSGRAEYEEGLEHLKDVDSKYHIGEVGVFVGLSTHVKLTIANRHDPL